MLTTTQRQLPLTPFSTPYNVAPFGQRYDRRVARNSKIPEFEQALDELERLVEKLERGDLPLDDALKTFERGVELTRHCQSALKAAQQRVEILLSRGGEVGVEVFAAAEDEAAEAGGAILTGDPAVPAAVPPDPAET